MKLTADALNHLLRQTPGAATRLRPYSGKILSLSLPPLRLTLQIDGIGEFAPAAPDAPIDGEISITPGAAMRLLFQPEAASTLAGLSGDTQLASDVGKVLSSLKWDAEEDFSRLIGDIPAHELGRAASRFKQSVERQAWSLAGMLAEYWLEEQPLLAKKRHVEKFCNEVDQLRNDVERLDKRLARLERTD